jgi:hypothetical protein
MEFWRRSRTRGSQTAPFVVGEPHSSGAQSRLQDPVLCAQVLDHLLLLVLEPADKEGDEQGQRASSAARTKARVRRGKPVGQNRPVVPGEALRCDEIPLSPGRRLTVRRE